MQPRTFHTCCCRWEAGLLAGCQRRPCNCQMLCKPPLLASSRAGALSDPAGDTLHNITYLIRNVRVRHPCNACAEHRGAPHGPAAGCPPTRLVPLVPRLLHQHPPGVSCPGLPAGGCQQGRPAGDGTRAAAAGRRQRRCGQLRRSGPACAGAAAVCLQRCAVGPHALSGGPRHAGHAVLRPGRGRHRHPAGPQGHDLCGEQIYRGGGEGGGARGPS